MHSRAEERANPINRRIGRRLKHARMLRGLTLEGLGEIIGVSYQQVQKYEAGVNAVVPEKLILLSRAVEMPITYFFDDEKADEDTSGERHLKLERLMRKLQKIERCDSRLFQCICLMVGAVVRAEE